MAKIDAASPGTDTDMFAAREVVERAITHVNDLGLLAEEVDPHQW